MASYNNFISGFHLPMVYGRCNKITSLGKVIKGAKSIQEALQKQDLAFDTVIVKKNVPINDRDPFEYEISTIREDDDSYLDQLLIWKKENGTRKRVLEFVAPADEWNPENKEVIDQARKNWIFLCNQHNAKALVEEMYAPNAIYYNHKPAIIGHEAISKEYQYMNNPDYKLSLSPIHLELVNERLAFEIGQCSGSYGGKYIIAWQKSEEGKWRVLMDSNL